MSYCQLCGGCGWVHYGVLNPASTLRMLVACWACNVLARKPVPG